MLNDGRHHQDFAPGLGHRLPGMVSHTRQPMVLGQGQTPGVQWNAQKAEDTPNKTCATIQPDGLRIKDFEF
eukprot:gene18686-6105_t